MVATKAQQKTQFIRLSKFIQEHEQVKRNNSEEWEKGAIYIETWNNFMRIMWKEIKLKD